MIKGWDVGIIGMKKNSKRLLVVPPEMAEGSKDIGPLTPPDQVLIFQLVRSFFFDTPILKHTLMLTLTNRWLHSVLPHYPKLYVALN